MYKKINGYPGYGYPGIDGINGELGASIHFIDNDASLIEQRSNIKLNDFVYRNDMRTLNIITVRDIDNDTIYSEPIMRNTIVNLFDKTTDNYGICNYPLVLTDNLKTVTEINDKFNNISYLSISTDSSIINVINDSSNIKLNYNSSSHNYDIETSTNLYVNNILTSSEDVLSNKYGYPIIAEIIKSIKVLTDSKSNISNWDINYNTTAGRFALSYIDISSGIEYFIKDYDNDILYITKPVNDTSINNTKFKLYYISNNTINKNDCVEIIFDPFVDNMLNIENVTVKNNNDNSVITDVTFTTRSINITHDSESNVNVSITFSGTIISYSCNNSFVNSLELSGDNKILCFNLDTSTFNNKTYDIKLFVNDYEYLIHYVDDGYNSVPELSDEIYISEYNDHYLSLNSNTVETIIPANNFAETYIIKGTNDCNVSIDISFNNFINNKRSNLNIYAFIDAVDVPFNTSQVDLINKNVQKCENYNGIINFNIENNDLSSAKKLIIYYEYLNDPEYAICNSKITITENIKAEDEDINDKKTISKQNKTLIMPWQISGFDVSTAIGYNFDVRAYCSLSRPENGYKPEQLSYISIFPKNIKNESLYSTRYNPVIVNSNMAIDTYATTAYLKYAYNCDNTSTNTITFYYAKDETTSANINCYFQIKDKYPIWSEVLFSGIDAKTYSHSKLCTATGGAGAAPYKSEQIVLKFISNNNYAMPTNNSAIFNHTDLILGGAEWSIRKTEYVDSKNEYEYAKIKSYDYKFANLSELINDKNGKNKTLYGLYWLISPRYVSAGKGEINYNAVINVLKQPVINKGNIPGDNPHRYIHTTDYEICEAFMNKNEYDMYSTKKESNINKSIHTENYTADEIKSNDMLYK